MNGIHEVSGSIPLISTGKNFKNRGESELGTLNNLRYNSKPIIWFVIIVVLIGFVGIGAFNVIAQNKLELFGMTDPERASLAIDGEISRHDGQNLRDINYLK